MLRYGWIPILLVLLAAVRFVVLGVVSNRRQAAARRRVVARLRRLVEADRVQS